jgi:hypothetical protein
MMTSTAVAMALLLALPDAPGVAETDFERHVAPLLGRLGCNAGSCHGSFQGRGGLGLSLFGHDPERDHRALTHDGMGRRINTLEPDRSLLLLKPTAQVPHEGGQRFGRSSWEYRVVRDWIAAGANRVPGRGNVFAVAIEPSEYLFHGPGESLELRVVVTFADGTHADMTRYCEFRAKDEAIAEVSTSGAVRGVQPGDTAIIASYRGHLVASRLLVPVAHANDLPQEPADNLIDREVLAKLRKLRIAPSGPASDAEFLRRVTIDVVGRLPRPADVRAFLADSDPLKRSKLLDALLAHPRHAALWATRFCDITAANVDALEGPPELRPARARMWHDWFRRRIVENTPYDAIVRGVLCATSREGQEVGTWLEQEARRLSDANRGLPTDYAERASLDLFWRRSQGEAFFPVEQMAELTATAFLGVRIECAQCHKHPFDRWTQADYRGYANIFAKVRVDTSDETRAAVARWLDARRRASPDGSLPAVPRLREVYAEDRSPRRLLDPVTNGPLPPRALGGPELSAAGDAREALFDWLERSDNPFLARSFVNRVWAVYFGVGLVDPVDGFSVANPPSNERLLDALAAEFRASGYDIRRLERSILSSQAYQRSSVPNARNRHDRANYARSYPRPLMAEVALDVLDGALGRDDADPRAIDVAESRVTDPDQARAFRVFGRPLRTTTCDCERERAPGVTQTLFRMTDRRIRDGIATGRLPALLASGKCAGEIIEELFLATLSRPPSDDERASALAHVAARPSRTEAFTDVLWALINTREFLLNH